MKIIPLTQGYVALVSDEDYERVSQFKWYAHIRRRRDGSIRSVYAMRNPSADCNIQYLHRFILGVTDPGIDVDHENADGLDNQRYNLRTANKTQTQGNRRKGATGLYTSSQFKGVGRHVPNSKNWIATLSVRGKKKHLGSFPSEVEAAIRYDVAAREYFGEFALCNFPIKKPVSSTTLVEHARKVS